ncbi:hypothetical protein BHE74_00021156 [Ensete ventricosum]|nr:hypothetical protein BHE74_00021156 [Ensete ventricosum]
MQRTPRGWAETRLDQPQLDHVPYCPRSEKDPLQSPDQIELLIKKIRRDIAQAFKAFTSIGVITLEDKPDVLTSGLLGEPPLTLAEGTEEELDEDEVAKRLRLGNLRVTLNVPCRKKRPTTLHTDDVPRGPGDPGVR